jgi:hypothetical protein
LPFTLNIEGRFNRRELALGNVRVKASNEGGDTGTLTLDGARELELVRQYLGAPADPVFDLDFSEHGNARPYLGEGWHQAGGDLTWTDGQESWIHFGTPSEPGVYVLLIRYHALIVNDINVQSLGIYLNGEMIGGAVTPDWNQESRQFRFDHAQFGGVETSSLRLHHPTPARPCDHSESPDTRMLAFAIYSMSLVRLLSPE